MWRAGKWLCTIDGRRGQAGPEQGGARRARSQATLVNARTGVARSETLAASQAASQEEVEQRRATVRAGEADVAAGRAAVRAAELNVGFTRVTAPIRSEEHTSELQSLMRISYAVFCLKKKKTNHHSQYKSTNTTNK